MRIKLDRKEISKQLLNSEETTEALREVAETIAKRAGEGYQVDDYKGKRRANVSIHPGTRKAQKDCLDNNTLLKAIGR